jgi:hypothetical protein
MGGAMADTSPLTFKKRLPSSPYPQRSPMLSSPTVPAAKDISSLGRPQQEQKPARNNSVSLEDDDQFDYISAYVNSIGPSDEGSDNHENSGPVQAINGSGRAAG